MNITIQEGARHPQGYREPEFDDVYFLSIESYSNHPEVYKAAELLFTEFSQSRKQIRNKDKYPKDARKLVASLWMHKGLFRFTTKNSHFTKGKRKQVWLTNRVLDLFKCAISLGWIELVKDALPPYAAKDGVGFAAIYTSTDFFKTLLTHLSEKDIVINPDLPCITRKDELKQIIEEEDDFYKTKKYLKFQGLISSTLRRLQSNNTCWADGMPISPVELVLSRKFNIDFSHGGRFYCNFQNKPKAIRNSITINGKPVGSLDITQCHPMLILRIYNGKEKEDGLFSQFNEDVYQVTGYEYLDRDLRKKVINTLFNAKTLDSGVKSILNTRWWIDGFTNQIEIKTFEKKQKRYGERVFENKVEIINFLECFKLQHPLFSEMLGSGVGLELQGFDGSITHNMLKLADKLDIPMIPIHEEYLCKEEDKLKIIELLRGALKITLKNHLNTGRVNAKWTDSKGAETKVTISLD